MPKKRSSESTSDSDSGPDDVSFQCIGENRCILRQIEQIAFLHFSSMFMNQPYALQTCFYFYYNFQRTPAKKAKGQKSDAGDGDGIFDLGKNRKVSVREFKGKVLIDIREFYNKDGKDLPGKKGIALSGEQWRTLIESADEINAAIAKH